jgi:hypothetical protein
LPVSEILQIREGAPISEAALEAHDINAIAESLVARIHKNRELAVSSNHPDYDYWKDTEVRIHLHAKSLDVIREQGLLNTFQISEGDAGRKGYLDWRAATENELIRTSLAQPGLSEAARRQINRLRPKYGILELTSPRSFIEIGDGSRVYGEVVAVLRPEVKKRTTWTIDDSAVLYAVDRADAHTLWFKAENSRITGRGRERLRTKYLEAQVWGDLGLQDVKEFLIPSAAVQEKLVFTQELSGYDRSKVLETLRPTGVPVYEYDEVTEHGRWSRKKGRLLLPAVSRCGDWRTFLGRLLNAGGR